jgi:lipooligosaccharide transport system ATP-binding protein
MSENVVVARNLTKVYGNHRAVDSIDFSVTRGEIFGLLGPNGAGKSTTMRMIACRTPLTSGELLVESLNVNNAPRHVRAQIGVVPQENNLDPDLNVLDNLLVYARYFRIPRTEALARSHKLLNFTGLSGRVTARVDELSGGMKRRLMIARALLHQPKLLVLDEPTTGLDPQVRQEIWQRLAELQKESGATIIISTHYMEEAEKLCERLIVLDQGRILASGAPQDLVRQSVSRYALEVRDCDSRPLQEAVANIQAVSRNGAHLYFAADPEILTPLMKYYEGYRMLIRPSNLEDVFLQLVVHEESGNQGEPRG